MIRNLVFIGLAVGLSALAILALWRQSDRWALARVEAELIATRLDTPPRYEPGMLSGQPYPVQRYFNAMLRPGTQLQPTVQLEMTGTLMLGTNALPFDARQTLSFPHGFTWAITATEGVPVGGSDSHNWTRFWVAGLAPVARAGGTDDHRRSALGRYAMEALVWSPAAVLPGPHAEWGVEDDDHLTVTLRAKGLEEVVHLTLGPDGRPLRLDMQRWSDQTEDGAWGRVAFAGRVLGYIESEGRSIASPVEVGYNLDAPGSLPFFKAQITGVDLNTSR